VRKKKIRVSAVGTGTGEVGTGFLAEIVARGREARGTDYSVIYQVVESNLESVDYFRGVVTKDDNLSKVSFKWYTGFFEPFCEEFKKADSNKEDHCDFAHFVRYFYHIESVFGLNITYNYLLAKDGIVAVVGKNENVLAKDDGAPGRPRDASRILYMFWARVGRLFLCPAGKNRQTIAAGSSRHTSKGTISMSPRCLNRTRKTVTI